MHPTEVADRARDRAPSTLVRLSEDAQRHNVLMLAAGLAFYGILSIGPALGVGFGVLRLLAAPEAADAVIDLLEGTIAEQLGLVDLLEQMEDRAGRYAGIGLLVLLWPATTLASGWTRALNDVLGAEDGNASGLKGRVRGLLPGAMLVAGMLILVGTVTFGAALLGGDGALMAVVLALGTIVFQALFNLLIYRWLPSMRWHWRELWPGALWATAGVVASTIGLVLLLVIGGGLGEQYPPALTTSIILGLWLYGANASLLLGAVYNHLRRRG